MMDNVFRWNLRGVLRNLHEAEVLAIFFPCFGRVLVVDLRCESAEGPMIMVDGMVGSAQERIRSIKQIRPNFPSPHHLTIAPWLGSVRGLESTGALKHLSERVERLGYPQARTELDQAYGKLRQMEREEMLALIRGEVDKTRTLWQR